MFDELNNDNHVAFAGPLGRIDRIGRSVQSVRVRRARHRGDNFSRAFALGVVKFIKRGIGFCSRLKRQRRLPSSRPPGRGSYRRRTEETSCWQRTQRWRHGRALSRRGRRPAREAGRTLDPMRAGPGRRDHQARHSIAAAPPRDEDRVADAAGPRCCGTAIEGTTQ